MIQWLCSAAISIGACRTKHVLQLRRDVPRRLDLLMYKPELLFRPQPLGAVYKIKSINCTTNHRELHFISPWLVPEMCSN